MDVAFITTDMAVRGAVRRVVELSNHLIKRGHDVAIYTQDGEPCEWLPLNAPIVLRSEIGHHDALICCGGGSEGRRLLRNADADIKALYVLGIGGDENRGHQEMDKALKKNADGFSRMVSGGTALIANCTTVASYFQDKGHDCGIVHGGVDFGTFHPRARNRNWRVLCAGTKRLQTGTADVLATMQIAKNIEPRLYHVSYAYQDLPQDKLAEAYSGAMCYLDAHYSGGWNNPVAEAMACGTAVVCTDIDGVADFAFHEETALLVKPQNVEAMALAVLRLAGNPDLRARLKENALHHILTYTWARAAGQLEGWLKEQA